MLYERIFRDKCAEKFVNLIANDNGSLNNGVFGY